MNSIKLMCLIPFRFCRVQFADSSHTDRIIKAAGIDIDNVFENRSKMDSVVGVLGKVKAQIGKIIFLLTDKCFLRLHIKAITLIQYFRIDQGRDILDFIHDSGNIGSFG